MLMLIVNDCVSFVSNDCSHTTTIKSIKSTKWYGSLGRLELSLDNGHVMNIDWLCVADYAALLKAIDVPNEIISKVVNEFAASRNKASA